MSTKSNTVDKIATIHQVEGFDPAKLAVEYTDLNTGETRKRLPVMAQIAWFRLLYPEGKISVTAKLANDYYVGHARVYRSYADPPEHFLAEATASRRYDPEKPTVSPREWAQTAAIGVALRNAGFGLQFHAAGDAFDQCAVAELGELPVPDDTTPEPLSDQPEAATTTAAAQTESAQAGPEKCSPEDEFEKALNMPCPIAKYPGKTLGDLLKEGEMKVLVWIAEKFTKDPDIAAAARLICETSLQVA